MSQRVRARPQPAPAQTQRIDGARRNAAAQRSSDKGGPEPPAVVAPAFIRGSNVTKKLHPGQPGTKRHTDEHGEALVCVRYRRDPMGLYRIKTVELVVNATPIHPRRFDLATFGLELGRGESELRHRLKAEGARWDPVDRLWWTRGAIIRRLGLVDRIRQM